MKVRCCGMDLRLKESYQSNVDSTITIELSALCPKCEALHSYRVYALDEEELESVKENL